MNRYSSLLNLKERNVNSMKDQPIKSRSVCGSTSASHFDNEEILSSVFSVDNSRCSWRTNKIEKNAKLLHNRTDSYKLAFPTYKNQILNKENSKPDTTKRLGRKNIVERISTSKTSNFDSSSSRQKRQDAVQNPTSKDSNTLDHTISFCKRLSVAAIYAPKRTNNNYEATPKKKRSPFCRQVMLPKRIKELMDKEEKEKQKVSFSDYIKLNNRVDKLELIFNKNKVDFKEEMAELNRSRSRIEQDGHPSLQDALHHSIPDSMAFSPPTRRVRRLNLYTEIIQYYYLYGIVTVLGLVLIAMTVFWTLSYHGSLFDFKNMHILLAMIGFFFLSSQGILVLRTTRYLAKENSAQITWRANMVHTVIHIVSVVISCTSIAMAIFSRHGTIQQSEHLYTLHSWIGLFTSISYTLITLISLLYFLPQFSKRMMSIFLPVHVSLGMASFFMIITSCLTGFMEVVTWTLGDTYPDLPPEGVLLNCIGVLMMVYCGFFIYLVQTVKDI